MILTADAAHQLATRGLTAYRNQLLDKKAELQVALKLNFQLFRHTLRFVPRLWDGTLRSNSV